MYEDVERYAGSPNLVTTAVAGILLKNLVSSGTRSSSTGRPIETPTANDNDRSIAEDEFPCIYEVAADISTKALVVTRNRDYSTTAKSTDAATIPIYAKPNPPWDTNTWEDDSVNPTPGEAKENSEDV